MAAQETVPPPPKRDSFVISFIPHKDLTKFLPLVVVLFLVASLPLAVVLVRQKQAPEKAEVGKVLPNKDKCGLIEVDVRELQACPRLAKVENGQVVPINPGQTNNLSTYTNIYTLKNIAPDQQTHTVKYKTYSSFCSSAYGHLYAPKNWIVCNDNPQSEEKEVTIEPGQTVEVRVERSSPTGIACGTYQLDLNILAVDGNENCTYRGPNPGETVGAWGYCETGISCPEAKCLCDQVTADKDLNNLAIGEVVNFTGRGKTNHPQAIEKIKFIISKNGRVVKAQEVSASLDREEGGWRFYKADFPYTIEDYGDYTVAIQAACPQGKWQD